MSGILGIFKRNGDTVATHLISKMISSVEHRAIDGVESHIDGPIGMAHMKLYLTPESIDEIQPLADESNTLWLALHGRIDNRSELVDLLEAKDFSPRFDTDAEIVLKAFQCWGTACPEYIVGDFAFVVWDSNNQRLFCSRDILGIKPFYYYISDEQFIWASEPKAILEVIEKTSINEVRLTGFLVNQNWDKENTLFSNIYRLKPAHSLIVETSNTQHIKYWDIDFSKTITYKNRQDYAEHFIELLRQSVDSRIRHVGSLGMLLSGGIDSRTVASMLQVFRHEGDKRADFGILSLSYKDARDNETETVQRLSNNWGVQAHFFDDLIVSREYVLEQCNKHADYPGFPPGLAYKTLRDHAQANNYKVLLSGWGGDDWQMGLFAGYSDMVAQKHFFMLLRQYLHDVKKRSLSIATSRLLTGLRDVFLVKGNPKLVGFAKALRKKARTQPNRWPWINPTYVSNYLENPRPNQVLSEIRFSNFVQKLLYTWLVSSSLTFFLELHERMTVSYGFEERYPLHDKRIIEFMFALPADFHWLRPYKTLLIEAQEKMSVTNSSISFRNPEASRLMMDTIESLGGRALFSNILLSANGIIFEKEVLHIFDEARQDYNLDEGAYQEYSGYLWHILAIDMWLRWLNEQDELSLR
ncbi:MAG: hypothetical protein H6670_15695 [Anaerolineaceae bacterium]|nr:hypothetical protein [Anaerolineaceae bacterium]